MFGLIQAPSQWGKSGCNAITRYLPTIKKKHADQPTGKVW